MSELTPYEIEEKIWQNKRRRDELVHRLATSVLLKAAFIEASEKTASAEKLEELNAIALVDTQSISDEMDELDIENEELKKLLPTEPYIRKAGSFAVKSGKLRVSDPCYSRDTWCAGVLDNVENGEWSAEALMFPDAMTGNWGTRVAELRVFNGEEPESEWIKSDIHVGVDSGQGSFFDDSEYPEDPGDYHGDTFYSKCCGLSNPVGTMECGVVSSSGYGDGGYDCHYKVNNAGNIVAAKITFILENEEEEEENVGEEV
jgi:hypothetical protein